MKPKQSQTKDPFFGLKYIAYCRTGLPVNEVDLDMVAMLQFAKWQICKVRNVLFNDPVWDEYTDEEILTEFFAIKFDEDSALRKEFEAKLVTAKASDIDWLERMAQKDQAVKNGKINGDVTPEKPKESPKVEFHPEPPSEFEDSF
jgi:hypothetical protein